MALSGTLQSSHIHVANQLNLVIHTSAAESKAKQILDSASAYSISPASRSQKLIIGDSLTLTFHTRFYAGSYLPLTNATALHGFWTTLSYCVFAAGASAAICIVYFRGVDLPRRLRFHGSDRLGGLRGEGLPKYNGYGYTGLAVSPMGNGVANGNGYGNGNGNGYGGYGMTGKRD